MPLNKEIKSNPKCLFHNDFAACDSGTDGTKYKKLCQYLL